MSISLYVKCKTGCKIVSLRAALKQHAGKVAVVEFEMSLVIELEQSRTVRMVLLEMEIVKLWLWCGVATVLTHIHLESN